MRKARTTAAVLLATLCWASLLVPADRASAATDEQESCFIIASYRLFWREDPSFEAFSYWMISFDQSEPYSSLPELLATGDPWLGVTVDDLYRQALDRTPDASGRQHWMDRLAAGVLVNALGSQIYGSNEFYRRAGSTNEGFVIDLYRRILHRGPSPGEVAYWVGKVNASSRSAVAAAFFGSPESRADRVTSLFVALLGRTPDPGGLQYWKQRLIRENDVRLAVYLASSSEFFGRTMIDGECLDPR